MGIWHPIYLRIFQGGDIYIHRIGRTGRGQQVGIAFSLVESHEIPQLSRIQYHMQAKIPISKIKGMEAKTKVGKAVKAHKKPHKKKIAKKMKKK